MIDLLTSILVVLLFPALLIVLFWCGFSVLFVLFYVVDWVGDALGKMMDKR